MPVEIAGKAIDAMPRSPATSTDRRWAEASFASSWFSPPFHTGPTVWIT